MKYLFSAFLIMISLVSKAQTITVMDFVRVNPGMDKEAYFYYMNNWKLYRDSAISKGIITGYRMEKTSSDSAAAFNLVLITEYKDRKSYENSEENFRNILSTLRPKGPLLLNGIQPKEFRSNLFVKVTEQVAAQGKQQQ